MKTIEIANKSTEQLLNWNDAVSYVKTLGNGWRLPSIEELKSIYESDNDFVEGTYWSNDESEGTATLQNFYSGYQYNADKRNGTCVRAVRDMQMDLFAQ